MYEQWVLFRNSVGGFLYRNVAKPLLFLQDPEVVHNHACKRGQVFGCSFLGRRLLRFLFDYQNKILGQNLFGINFSNPIGLSAGFDKNAELTSVIPCVGFGHEEVGSVTGDFCPGNPKPRLWRLPASKSLIVYYGLKNKGCKEISERLSGRKFGFPLGVSVAKTNSKKTVPVAAGIADYVKALKAFSDKNVGDYYTINISCPNVFGGEPFTDPKRLELLLKAISKLNVKIPLFLKLSPDINLEILEKLFTVALRYDISGFICSNLTKNWKNKRLKGSDDEKVQSVGRGGLSGKAVEDLSTDHIRFLYKKIQMYKKKHALSKEIIIIGCGGIFTAEDAYQKIRSGASLLQMITGMIYCGPGVISEINQGLVRLLERDGFGNIREAVGVDVNVKI